MNLIEFRRATIMRGERAALRDLDLAIPAGESVAILGPNGCGKSTLIGAILREFYPLRRVGSWIRIRGEEFWNIEDLRASIGIVKNTLLPPKAGIVSSRELVVSSFFGSVGLWNHQKPSPAMWSAADSALDRVGAAHLASRDIDELSSGEARRIEIARVLAHNPPTLLLDEPANHLDPRAQAELRTLVSTLALSGTAIIMVTHHVSDIVPEIDRVVMLRDGVLFRDGAKSQLLHGEVLTELFGHPISLFRRNGMFHAY
jgi:iron complex transport system ATP-binding protein